MRQKILALINSNFNANEVANLTGIPTNTVYRIFNGEANLDNITLKNAEKLSAFWDKNKLRDYGYVHELVTSEIMDNNSDLYDLASEWLEIVDSQEVINMLAEQYHQAANGVTDFDMSLRDYVLAGIEQSQERKDYIKDMDYGISF